MDYRRLGQSGLMVSSIGIGCNNFGGRMDLAETQAVVDKAIDLGITLFDTADVYGGTQSEIQLGQALGKRRQDVIVATKFGIPMNQSSLSGGGSRRYIMASVEGSLKRLGTDYIDLYQMHRADPNTPIEETMAAMDDLVTSGKVRYIGNSNYAGWQIAEADLVARTRHSERFISAQNNFSLLERRVEHEVIPACEHFGLGMLPFFPLASGLLTGKYRRNEDNPKGTRLAERDIRDRQYDQLEALEKWAQERDHSLLELAFAWLLASPSVSSVIAGATKPEQVDANASAGGWLLAQEERAEVTSLLSS
ncbi:MAG: aldo/keto reductase [Gammaproteobacteria bacterium]|nr:aldo/keto reductase [Gammaproteobacteria bacterium]RPG26428.1 MAG: aldo/keto reductase [Gammaproteobacteria bacterium TMED50]|tara:strand:- start:12223 stop:13143 length:921 start_codon:yes stop_codon:yes gene_type:complete